MASAKQISAPDPANVLAKALFKAAEQLGLNQTDIGDVLGLHRTAVSKLKARQYLDPNSKEGELALLLIRLARSLFALMGADTQWIRHFMTSPNQVTGGVPKQQIKTIQGLVSVLQFTDAIRGKV